MFLSELDSAACRPRSYLTRLAAEATTVINAVEYARAVRDLALRRNLILVGEEISAVAYDSPADSTPRHQIEEAERKLYGLAESGRFEGGFQRFDEALSMRSTGPPGVRARGHPLRHRDGTLRPRPDDGRPAAVDLIILAGRPGMGKDGARHQHRVTTSPRPTAPK